MDMENLARGVDKGHGIILVGYASERHAEGQATILGQGGQIVDKGFEGIAHNGLGREAQQSDTEIAGLSGEGVHGIEDVRGGEGKRGESDMHGHPWGRTQRQQEFFIENRLGLQAKIL